MSITRATQTVVVTPDGGTPVVITEGDPFDSRDSIVKEFPWLFRTDVEEATARPGERRNVTRKP